MATNFVLTLDTTPPDAAISINSAAPYTTSQVVTAGISSVAGDAFQMKVWGDVDNTNDANVQTTEGASAWITYATSKSVKLSTGDGVKTLNLKIRDDVGNTSSGVADTITLDTTAPVPTISVAASPTKISKVATFDTSTFTFTADSAIQAWKVKVVPSSGSTESAGTTIPTTAGSTATTGGALGASTPQVVTIKGTDLETASAGDGAKTVKIFVQDLAGTWSV